MNEEQHYFYEFGDFRLKPREKTLYHADITVALKPKAVEMLIVLVENAETVVSKKDLMDRVWQDLFVEENNLSVNIYELRRAFAKFDADGKYIETVPRRGFRFCVPVKKILTGSSVIDAPAPQNPAHRGTSPSAGSTFRGRIFAAAAIVMLLGTGLLLAWRRAEPQAAADPVRMLMLERGTNSVEAYQMYMRGRELWQTRINADMEKGVEFFRRAIEIDPNFVAPYLGIADSLSMMKNDPEDWRQAEEYANKALALDPNSADAHASMGFILAMNKWQWADAETEFQRALALDPNSGKAHQWYATLLEIERRFPEAETHLKKAIEIEPLSPNYNVDLCELYYFANKYDAAFEQCRRTNEITPKIPLSDAKMFIYIQQKRYDEAAQVSIDNSVRLGSTETEAKDQDWFKAYKNKGFRGWMQYNIDVNSSRADVMLTNYELSLSYAMLGNREKTLAYLEQCYSGHTFLLPFVNARPEYDFLRGDPQFQALMARIGLDKY